MSILLFILFGSITLSFWSVCIASGRADKKLEYLHLQKEKGEHYVRQINYRICRPCEYL